MLNAHSHIAIPEELTYFQSSYAGVPIEEWRTPKLSADDYETLVREFVNNASSLHPELDAPGLIDTILADGPGDLRRPYATVLNAWANQHGATRWGEKTPGNLFYVDVIQEMFPDAYFVYVVRDPRAGVASMLKTDFFPDDVVFNALSRWKHARVGERLLHAHVPPNRWCTVRYEDLTTEPEPTLQRICAMVGEPYEPSMLRYHRTAENYMKSEAATSFNAAATRPVTTKQIDAWKEQLTERAIAMIETVCARDLRQYGYARSGARMSVGAWITLVLKATYWGLQSVRNWHERHYTVKHAVFARLRTRLGWA